MSSYLSSLCKTFFSILLSLIIDTISFPSFSFWFLQPLIPPFLPCHLSILLSVLPSIHLFFCWFTAIDSFLMSCEMRCRDHSATGRRSLSSNSHHSSIIHMLIFISGMRTFILKWYSIFMSQSRGIRLHLFWQKTSVSPALYGHFLCIEHSARQWG